MYELICPTCHEILYEYERRVYVFKALAKKLNRTLVVATNLPGPQHHPKRFETYSMFNPIEFWVLLRLQNLELRPSGIWMDIAQPLMRDENAKHAHPMLSQLPQGFPEARELKSTAAPLKNPKHIPPNAFNTCYTYHGWIGWMIRQDSDHWSSRASPCSTNLRPLPTTLDTTSHAHPLHRTLRLPNYSMPPYQGCAVCRKGWVSWAKTSTEWIQPTQTKDFKTSNPTIILEQITLLRVIAPDTLCWHSFWHIIWKYTRHMDICVCMYVYLFIYIYVYVCTIIYIHTYITYIHT